MRGFSVISGTVQERVAAIARLQRGRLSRRQLFAAGVGEGALKGMVKRGLLHREHAGVYAVLGGTDVPLARETSALLACGERAVLSHASAAAVWGVAPDRGGPVDVTVQRSERGRTRKGIKMHRAGGLLSRDVRIHQGLPVTSPARTLLDYAAQATPRDAERAVDEALVVLEIVRREELEDVLERAPSHRGAPILKRLLHRRGPAVITESEAEKRFLALIRQAGLPLPETQVPIAGYKVDFFWREYGVAFEIDGYRFHKSRSAFDRDRRKDAAVKDAGVDPNRVSRDQIKYEPLAVVANVTAALTRARLGQRGLERSA
jgi:very-short-patch-repair endonuclease